METDPSLRHDFESVPLSSAEQDLFSALRTVATVNGITPDELAIRVTDVLESNPDFFTSALPTAKQVANLEFMHTAEDEPVLDKSEAAKILARSPRPKHEVSCAQCGEHFMAVRRDAKYCSKRCDVRAFRQRKSTASSAA